MALRRRIRWEHPCLLAAAVVADNSSLEKAIELEGQGLSSTSDLLFIFLPRVAVCPGSKQSITLSSIAEEPLSPLKLVPANSHFRVSNRQSVHRI